MPFFSLSSRISKITPEEYNDYLKIEWRLFTENPARAKSLLDAAPELVRNVLDVGCGAGQEMLPFICEKKATGFGIDIAAEVGEIGYRYFREIGLENRVGFIRAKAESLPFPDKSFEVVICRIALPYMNNDAALAEMTRVLKDGGVLFIKIHHFNYYLKRLVENLGKGNFFPAVHAVRVILAGIIYHLTGFQKPNRVVGNEVFQTTGLLRKKLARHHLSLRRELTDSNSETPSLAFIKTK